MIDRFDICFGFKDILPIITVYRKPPDYANKYVARLYYIKNGLTFRTKFVMVRDTFDEIEKAIPETMDKFDRDPDDVKAIVCTYM